MKVYQFELFCEGEVALIEYYSTKAKAKKRLKALEKQEGIKLVEQKDYEISKLDVM